MNYRCLTCKHFTYRLTPEQLKYIYEEAIDVIGACKKKQLLFLRECRSFSKCKLYEPKFTFPQTHSPIYRESLKPRCTV